MKHLYLENVYSEVSPHAGKGSMSTYWWGPEGIGKIMSLIHIWPVSAQSSINNWSLLCIATVIFLHIPL